MVSGYALLMMVAAFLLYLGLLVYKHSKEDSAGELIASGLITAGLLLPFVLIMHYLGML